MRLIGSTQIFQDAEIADADRRIRMTSVIQAADLGFFGMPLDVHTVWMERLAEEMAQQGDNEKALSMPISPMCDRSSQDLPGMALGMLKLLAMPLFDEIFNLVKKANPGHESEREIDAILVAISGNQVHWEAKRRGPRGHLGSFDMFIPIPKPRTITTGSDFPLPSEGDPGSPPSLIAIDSPFSGSAQVGLPLDQGTVLHIDDFGDNSEDEEDDDDGPPILPFSAVHKI